jgi:hypothetical protein
MPESSSAGASSSPPATVVCARCGGAIEPGLARCPACGASQTRPGAAGRTGAGPIGMLMGLLGLALPLAWVWPDVFRHLGLSGLSDWLGAGRHRILMLVPIWMALMVSYGVQRMFSRVATQQAWQPFAAASGGEVVTRPLTIEAGVWKGGVEVRSRARGWLLTLDTARDRSDVSTRLSCAVSPRRNFHFALMPQSRVLKVLSSPRVGGFLLALGEKAAAAEPEAAARRLVQEEMGFIVGPPVELGEPEFDGAFLLKSDDADAARDFFGDQRGALLALRRPGSWWQLTLTASVTNGTGQLEYRESGLVRDAARLEAVRQAMIGMLDRLAANGIIAAESPASKT